MLRADSPTVHPAAPCLGLVLPEFSGLTPCTGLGLHYGDLARTLAKSGWDVQLLLCPAGEVSEQARQAARRLAQQGIGVTWLADVTLPPAVTLDGPNQFPALDASERVRHVLAQWQRRRSLDLIEFPDRGGLGFRTVQARRVGLDRAGPVLVVKVHGPTASLRHAAGQWPAGPAELAADWCERYAFEHADVRLVAAPSCCPELDRLGWAAGEKVGVCLADKPETAGLYQELLRHRPRQSPASPACPLVTVGVPFFNLGAYLGEALASLAAQTYPALEVVVIDDGSTDPAARAAFATLRERYPCYRFLTQANAGIGATRNRALHEAGGEYFLPLDADNVAHPEMVARLVAALDGNEDLAAVGSYFLAFDDAGGPGQCRYAYRPTGGPHVLASLWNVYGDGNALFRTAALRAVGGFEADRDTSWEDWEVFVKLVNAGFAVDVVPEPLFYYRHRPGGFSRITDGYRNHQRVLRRFVEIERLPRAERVALWNALAGFGRRLEFLEDENRTLRQRLASRRHRLVDWLGRLLGRRRPSRSAEQPDQPTVQLSRVQAPDQEPLVPARLAADQGNLRTLQAQ